MRRQPGFGQSQQGGQAVESGVILIFFVYPAGFGLVLTHLEIEHITQGAGAHPLAGFGILQLTLVKEFVGFGDGDVFLRQLGGKVRQRHGRDQQSSGIVQGRRTRLLAEACRGVGKFAFKPIEQGPGGRQFGRVVILGIFNGSRRVYQPGGGQVLLVGVVRQFYP